MREAGETGRRALVIGCSSPGGLGEAAALRLADAGDHVTVVARNEDAVGALAQRIGGDSAGCDITDEAAVARLLAGAEPLDIIVNAAGTTCAGRLAGISRKQIEEQMTIHFTANALLLKHAIGAMPGGGAIVLFSSLTASLAGAGLAAYSCAKAALEHLVRIAAVELGERAIRVNAVAPGFARTPMTEPIFANPPLREAYLDQALLRQRSVSPAEVASAVQWLVASDCFVTGEIVQVSGGAQLGRLPGNAQLRQLRGV